MFFGTVSVPSLLCVLLVGPLGFSDATNYQIEWIVEDYDDQSATVGDSVTFSYNVPNHNLYIHPTGSCSEDGKIIVGEDSGEETYVFTDADVPSITFACDVAQFGISHCDLGQIITFSVSPAPADGAPTTSPDADDTEIITSSPIFCFSGNMEVDVQGKGTVAMEKLQVGDFVKTGNGDAYEQVYAFGHRVPNKHTEFVQIHTSMDNPLEMSAEHLVFVEGKTNPVRADSIKAGDILQAQDNHAVVQSIKSVTRNGIYSPLTGSGTIQVNGITASNYISFQKENDEYAEFQGGVEIMSHHDAAHIAMTPYRFYCTTLAICDMNDADSGMPYYVSMGIELIEWSKQQNILVQLFVYASFRMLLLASILMTFAVLMIPVYLLSGCSIFQMQRITSHISTIGVRLSKGMKMKKEN